MPSFKRAIVSLGSSIRGLLEGLEPLFEKLLVHVGRAQIVQARSLDGIRLRLGPCGAVANSQTQPVHAGENN
jgi:hypothetical protein